MRVFPEKASISCCSYNKQASPKNMVKVNILFMINDASPNDVCVNAK